MGLRGGERRWVWVALLVLVGCSVALLAFVLKPGGTARAGPDCPTERPIVIDPGHGGIDGGTNVPGMLEKDVALDIALRTARHLEHHKVPVVLTRDGDYDLGGRRDGGRLRRDLIDRIRTANRCRAVLMLSLHINSTQNQSERGLIIFYQGSQPSRDAAYFMDDLLRRVALHERQEAPHVRDFAVVRWPKAPAMLVELGFLTNDEDRALLADPAYREKIAQALATACRAIYYRWVSAGGP